MTEFNKELFFKDAMKVLKEGDRAVADQENNKLLEDMSFEDRMDVLEGMADYFDNNNEEKDINVTMAASITRAAVTAAREDNSSSEEEGTETSEKEPSDASAEEAVEDTAESEGTAPAEEAKAE